MSRTESDLREILPLWLALRERVEVPLGLSREEALHRARRLRSALRDGNATTPTAVELDDDSKDVLYALCLLLEKKASGGPEGVLEEARRTYQFIESASWSDDELDEKPELLRRCAGVALRALGQESPGVSEPGVGPARAISEGSDAAVPRIDSPPESAAAISHAQKHIDAVFEESLGAIHAALVTHYRVEESMATEIESDLYVWFARFCTRSGSPTPKESRFSILVACCQAARDRQRHVVGTGVRETDEELKRLLDREPADAARDLAAAWRSSITATTQMPESARVLRFPERRQRMMLSSDEAGQLAVDYLETPRVERSEELVASHLEKPEVLLALLRRLKEMRDISPGLVAEECESIYLWLVGGQKIGGLFDEGDYFRGEAALLVANSYRLLGRRDEAELWLDRAESYFRHTVNPAPQQANVAYVRLGICYDRGQFRRVLESAQSLKLSFEKAGMKIEALKCRFVEALALKECAPHAEARERLFGLREDPALREEPALMGRVLMTLGEMVSNDGHHVEAASLFREALPLLDAPIARAHLKVLIGESLRNQGLVAQAVQAYRAAIADYAALEMLTWVAYVRIVACESLIALGRYREAEWEILAALPTIEEQKMVPEGFAAVALLKESVRRRKTDPKALRELREHLKANQN